MRGRFSSSNRNNRFRLNHSGNANSYVYEVGPSCEYPTIAQGLAAAAETAPIGSTIVLDMEPSTEDAVITYEWTGAVPNTHNIYIRSNSGRVIYNASSRVNIDIAGLEFEAYPITDSLSYTNARYFTAENVTLSGGGLLKAATWFTGWMVAFLDCALDTVELIFDDTISTVDGTTNSVYGNGVHGNGLVIRGRQNGGTSKHARALYIEFQDSIVGFVGPGIGGHLSTAVDIENLNTGILFTNSTIEIVALGSVGYVFNATGAGLSPTFNNSYLHIQNSTGAVLPLFYADSIFTVEDTGGDTPFVLGEIITSSSGASGVILTVDSPTFPQRLVVQQTTYGNHFDELETVSGSLGGTGRILDDSLEAIVPYVKWYGLWIYNPAGWGIDFGIRDDVNAPYIIGAVATPLNAPAGSTIIDNGSGLFRSGSAYASYAPAFWDKTSWKVTDQRIVITEPTVGTGNEVGLSLDGTIVQDVVFPNAGVNITPAITGLEDNFAKTIRVRLENTSGALLNFTWPAITIQWVGGAAPVSMAIGELGLLTLTNFNSTTVVAEYVTL